MKKVIIRNISIFLFLSIVLTNILSINAVALTAAEDHFGKLNLLNDPYTTLLPSENTCGYVAMSMLLTFYDSYWHKNFVEENYEWQQGRFASETLELKRTFSPINEDAHWENYLKTN